MTVWLVCGDRRWTDVAYLEWVLDRAAADDWPSKVRHGAAPGADALAGAWAVSRGIPEDPYPADWRRYGRAAGPIRNQAMLADGEPGRVIAFHHDLTASRGTRDMVERARRAGLPVSVYPPTPTRGAIR